MSQSDEDLLTNFVIECMHGPNRLPENRILPKKAFNALKGYVDGSENNQQKFVKRTIERSHQRVDGDPDDPASWDGIWKRDKSETQIEQETKEGVLSSIEYLKERYLKAERKYGKQGTLTDSVGGSGSENDRSVETSLWDRLSTWLSGSGSIKSDETSEHRGRDDQVDMR